MKRTPTAVRVQPLESRHHFAAGDPLESFGRHGLAVTPYALYAARLSDLQAVPGGTLLASVDSQTYRAGRPAVAADFVRFNADGSPDATFGGNGSIDTFFGTVRRIAVRSDGRFYALGSTAIGAKTVSPGVPWFVARFHADGRLDRSFGTHGVVALDLQNIANESRESDAGFGENRTSFLDTDGRLTMLVNYRHDNADSHYTMAVVRLDAAGRPDPTFADGSPVFLRSASEQFSDPSITVGGDGSVLVAAVRLAARRTLGGVLRLTPGGERDLKYGSNGFATASPGYVSSPHAAFGLDGRVYFDAAQSVADSKSSEDSSILVRLTARGAVDAAFAGGTIHNDSYSFTSPLLPMADGGVIVGGGQGPLQRYHADGTPDPAFGDIENISSMNLVANDVLYGLGPSVPLRDGDPNGDTNGNTGAHDVRYTVTAVSLNGTGPAPISLKNGTLTVLGTSASERLEVGAYPNFEDPVQMLDITRGFWSRRLVASTVKSLVLSGDGGDDQILVVAVAGRTPDLTATINGGTGNDRITVYGNPAHLTVHGNEGRDTVTGDISDSDA